MSGAATVCAHDRCPRPAVRRGLCAEHAPAPWAGSRERRERLGLAVPPAVRRAVREAFADRCRSCGADVPAGSGAVDHLDAGDPSSPLQLLCDECHRIKTRHDLRMMEGYPLPPSEAGTPTWRAWSFGPGASSL
jgi:hypothetical protein